MSYEFDAMDRFLNGRSPFSGKTFDELLDSIERQNRERNERADKEADQKGVK